MREEPAKGQSTRRPLLIGKYEIVSRIAVGGMGSVYKAVDRDLGRVVALKVLPTSMSNKTPMIERFRREARSAAKLRHENIVTLYDFREDEGTFYLVMEFVEGTDLQEYIDRKGTLDVDEAVNILRQALRALDHAYHEGIVHRDIKPSNFMLMRRGEELLVKLTDMGLARHETENDTGPLDRSLHNRKGKGSDRLTEAGTTVGTVDYMSPEQAQNSASADIRSDLYSLGCTLYHMLTGQPPFPTGSSTERLYKHIDEEPADVRSLNSKVPAELAAVLQRLMAKRPADRFQTPSEVLAALDGLESGDVGALPEAFDFEQRDVLAELARGETQPRALPSERPRPRGPRQRPGSDPVRRPPTPPPTAPDSSPTVNVAPRTRPSSKTKQSAPGASRQWMVIVGIGAVVVIAVAIVLGSSGGNPSRRVSTESKESPRAQHLPETNTTTQAPPRQVVKNETPTPRVVNWPVLFAPATPVDAQALRQKLQAPWAGDVVHGTEVPGVVVSRSYTGGDGNGHFGTLSAATAVSANKGATTVYDLQDPGPLFEPAVMWSDRNVVLRGAPGQRTLLVWDVNLNKDRKGAFLTLVRGNLTLENLDVVVRWPEAEAADTVTLLHLFDGDLTARNCSFSVAGKFKSGATLARLEGTKAGSRCRLQQCLVRGPLTTLELKSPGVETLIEDTLVAGGDQPLVQVAGRNQPTTTVRTSHSTFVGGHSFLTVRPASAADTKPAVAFEGWDTLLARSHELEGGDLIEFLDNADSLGLKWHAVNCLYAGWKTLLHDREPITAANWDRWRESVQSEEGDRAIPNTWPLTVRHDTSELAPSEYEIAPEAPVAFAATPEAGTEVRPFGSPLAALPPGRAAWTTRLFERYPVAALPTPDPIGEGLPIDIRQVPDLGAALQEYVRKNQNRLGPKLVVRLIGAGDWYTSPIQLKGISLVLRCDEPALGNLAPLALVARAGSAAERKALISIEGGDLELIGVELRMPAPGGIPPYLIQVAGGNLSVRGSRLVGALAGQAPGGYHGIISWTGSNEETPDRSRICTIQDSVLLSGRGCLEVNGGGARVHIEQSVLIAGSEAARFQPEGAKPRVNVQLTMDHATVASRQALIAVADAPQLGMAREPILIQPIGTAFLVPVEPGKGAPHATLLRAEGNALGRGLVLWQGEGNFYDQRLHAFVRAAEATRPEQQQEPVVWAHLWGTMPDRGAYIKSPGAVFNPAVPSLERFSLLGLALPRPVPGIDLTRPLFRRPLRTPF